MPLFELKFKISIVITLWEYVFLKFTERYIVLLSENLWYWVLKVLNSAA